MVLFVYFHPYLGKTSNLTNIFQMGWNHQPVFVWFLETLNAPQFFSKIHEMFIQFPIFWSIDYILDVAPSR